MAMSDHKAKCQAFKDCLYDIAAGLNEPDIHSLCFLYKDTISRQCICTTNPDVENILCPYHRSFSGVVLIDQLYERGVLSPARPDDVINLLTKIGRVDIADQFRDSFSNLIVTSPTMFSPLESKAGAISGEVHERDSVSNGDCQQHCCRRNVHRQAALDDSSVDGPIPLCQLPSSQPVSGMHADVFEEPAHYKVVFDKDELEEMKKMVEHSSAVDSDSRSNLVKKLESATLAGNQAGSTQEEKIPLRALSMDCFRPAMKYHGYAPDMTQSFDSLQKFPLVQKISRRCSCAGACSHSCGSGLSDSTSSHESIYSDEEFGQSKRCFKSGKSNGIEFVEWNMSRKDKFLNCIFDHKKVCHCKKVRISVGRGSAKKSVNILLKLFPNGIGDDLGISSTLTLSIIGMSNPECDLVLFGTFRGVDTREYDLITSRKFSFSVTSASKYLVEGFVPHEIIKQSSTKSFKFMFKFELRVQFKEWVLIDDVNVDT